MATNDNVRILEQLRGIPAQPETPETDADPRNPNVRPLDLGKLFNLLILARNSKDEESLQEAIDMVATASCRSLDF